MQDVRFETRPELRQPIFLVAYRGWNDAGSAASHALLYAVRQLGAERFASIDPEEFYDFTQARPYTRPVGEFRRELTWPGNDFYYARRSGQQDVLFLLGTEPHLRWRRYCRNVLSVAQECSVSESIALGALLADTPHTRPVPVSGGSSTPDLARRLKRLGINGSRYEGPTGILSVVGSMLTDIGISNGSIWAAVPHYISASPNPKAAAELVRHLNKLFSLDIPLAEIDEETDTYQSQIESAIAGNPEAQQYVQELELSSLANPDEPDLDLPPEGVGEPLNEAHAEGLIASVEEFLRQRQREQDAEGEGHA